MYGNDTYKNKSSLDSYSDWRSLDEETFIEKFKNVQWVNVLKLEKRYPDVTFNSFYENLDSLLKTCSSKKNTKKQFKFTEKPWLTKGIKKSMSLKDKMFKSFLQETDVQIKEQAYNRYKIYHNQITKLLRESKKNYYQQFFTLNMSNAKKTWKALKDCLLYTSPSPRDS